jgi:hypothetical protein
MIEKLLEYGPSDLTKSLTAFHEDVCPVNTGGILKNLRSKH